MPERNMERVEETWKEIGCRVRPLRKTIMVRTEPLPTKSAGGIILPGKLTTFYGELPHMQIIVATVLSSGRDAILETGDRIAFTRLFFARWMQLQDRTLIGWIANEENVLGYAEGENTYVPIKPTPGSNPPPPPGLGS